MVPRPEVVFVEQGTKLADFLILYAEHPLSGAQLVLVVHAHSEHIARVGGVQDDRERAQELEDRIGIGLGRHLGAISRLGDDDVGLDAPEVAHDFSNGFTRIRLIEIAVNNAMTAIADGKQRVLLTLATGTGKTLAYLLPAVIWALNHQERTVVSTHTINLQEQLLNKDIPLIREALGCDFKAVLVKGMNNYVCLRKLDDAKHEKKLSLT